MDFERAERRKKFKRNHKARIVEQNRIQFDSDENREYDVPVDVNKHSPIPTLSSCSIPSASRYLDEIALLKRGKITRDTPKHTYMRGKSKTNVSNDVQEQPITIAELNTRGLKLDENNIIYCVPDDVRLPEGESSAFQQSHNSSSRSSSSSIASDLKSPRNVREFDVGNPGENSKLRISSNAHDGPTN